MSRISGSQIDLVRLRALAQKKPRTKAGQVRQAWPEIRTMLAGGHSLKDVCAWLNECGLEIGYARLSDYVNQLRRNQPAPPQHLTATESRGSAAQWTAELPKPNAGPKKHDPLANLRASEAKRPSFHYRPAMPGDEKDLI